IAYGVGKAILFAVTGTLIDVLLFPDSQCEQLEGVAQGTAWKRRALIVFGALIIAANVP
ncbi:hypothetical protein HC761_00250, partial [bacterium]|nr:hypothetical protein [bacterium]